MQNNPGDDPGPFAIPPDDASRMILQPDPATAGVGILELIDIKSCPSPLAPSWKGEGCADLVF
ncbi:hypothetical protein, partial [Sphingomonas sp. RB1R13]|uniref:hypothetical protein n=1 Tax=Sphingomonas sp. RB1R13 TaxID=3096159 RepID=UPI002FC694E4